MGSPVIDSILITSAPMSASMRLQNGQYMEKISMITTSDLISGILNVFLPANHK